MSANSIEKRIAKAKMQRYLTNCYSLNHDVSEISAYWEFASSFAFAYPDHGVERIYFFAADESELKGLLSCAPKGKFYVEFIAKKAQEHEFAFSDAVLVARLKRVANRDCSSIFSNPQIMQFEDDSVGEYAKKGDAHEINRLLWGEFRTEISHLLSDEEVAAAIERREYTIHRNVAGGIDAVLQVVIQPRKFYTNHAVNHGEKNVINAMLINRMREYHNAGGKYTFCWVSEDNTASLKWNEKYGMTHDGTWNIIYRVERE